MSDHVIQGSRKIEQFFNIANLCGVPPPSLPNDCGEHKLNMPQGIYNTLWQCGNELSNFSPKTYAQPDLFAGKIHALLMRQWKTRVKGRDYYDFVWYLGRNIPVSLKHLEARLRQSGGWIEKKALDQESLVLLLTKRFTDLDVKAAKKDVEPFLKDPAATALWSSDFFVIFLDQLKVV